MEHKEVNALMERWAAAAAAERSDRKLVLHTETGAGDGAGAETTPLSQRKRRLAGWSWAAAASVAAAIVVGVVIVTAPAPTSEPEPQVVCMVNGEQITDPARIEQYTREALELADENLRRPASTLAQTLVDDLAMARVGEMLNELTNNQ